jgi:hypothetical protein
MALQTSGPISISNIKAELGSTSNSLRALSAAAGKSTPDAMSEFYGYASYTPPSYSSGASSISGAGTQASPYVVVTSWSGAKQDFSTLYDNDHYDNYSNRTEIWRATASMTQVNFTNQTSGNQRVHVSHSASSNFCAYADYPFEYIDDSSYFSQNLIGIQGQTTAIYASNGSQTPHQQLTGQTRTSDFNVSVGSNIYWRGFGYRDDLLVYNNGPFVFPCGGPMYGNIPNPSVSVTLTIWFEKL